MVVAFGAIAPSLLPPLGRAPSLVVAFGAIAPSWLPVVGPVVAAARAPSMAGQPLAFGVVAIAPSDGQQEPAAAGAVTAASLTQLSPLSRHLPVLSM